VKEQKLEGRLVQKTSNRPETGPASNNWNENNTTSNIRLKQLQTLAKAPKGSRKFTKDGHCQRIRQ